MTAPKEFHLIPVDRKEHIQSGECWCKPVLNAEHGAWVHDIYRPPVEETKNVDEVIAFFKDKTGEDLHEQMLKTMIGSIVRVLVVREDGKIIAMTAYASVINPFIGKMGYALLVDLSTGFIMEMPS